MCRCFVTVQGDDAAARELMVLQVVDASVDVVVLCFVVQAMRQLLDVGAAGGCCNPQGPNYDIVSANVAAEARCG